MRGISRALGRSRRRAALQSYETLESLGKKVSRSGLLSISSLPHPWLLQGLPSEEDPGE